MPWQRPAYIFAEQLYLSLREKWKSEFYSILT